MLDVGDPAPDFSLEDQNGETHRLADARGSWVVLYFYPRDDTPGCTKEACSFRDDYDTFTDLGAKVFGMSADDRASHAKFAEKYDLPFPLLVDPDKATLEAYDAYGEKKMYGKTYMGVKRITYLIDPEGDIAHVWTKVKTDTHAADVREVLEEKKAA